MNPIVEINDLRKTYAGRSGVVDALKGVSLSLAPGEFFTLLGPSGCGKTTMLRCLAGLETPDGGSIRIDGDAVYSAESRKVVPVNKRDISMVFQSYAIWPHMTVAENVGFPLLVNKVRSAERKERVEQTLALVGLAGYGSRPATDLSGGQQQRVAVARAIIKGARVLLLDEPLSNLDAMLRIQMRHELRELQQRIGTTTVYVTHDQEEALSLSDRIALMREGNVIEVGPPSRLYMKPQHPFTAEFIGQADLWPCTFRRREAGLTFVDTFLGVLAAGHAPELLSDDARAYVRPEHIVLRRADAPPPEEGLANRFEGTVEHVSFVGRVVEYDVKVHGHVVRAHSMSLESMREGDRVQVWLPPEKCVVVDEHVSVADTEPSSTMVG